MSISRSRGIQRVYYVP